MAKSKTSYLLRSFFVMSLVFFVLAIFIPATATAVLAPQDGSIITQKDIEISVGFTNFKGHICSREGDIRLNGTNGTISIPQDPTDMQWVLSAETGNITCSGDVVLGEVASNSVMGCNVIPIAPETCPPDPPFPLTNDTVPFPINGGTGTYFCNGDIVPDDQRPAPDTGLPYGDVVVSENCNFAGEGIYNMRSLWVQNGGKITFTPDDPLCDNTRRFDVNVERYVLLGHRAKFNIQEVYGVFVNVEGPDGIYNDDKLAEVGGHVNRCDGFEGKASFCFKGDGTIKACRIYVRDGTTVVQGNLFMETLIYSEYYKAIKRSGGLPVHTSIPCDDAGIPTYTTCCEGEPPEPDDCACNFLASIDNTKLVMIGHNFVDETNNAEGINNIDFIIFVPVGDPPGSTPIAVGNPLGAAECYSINPIITVDTVDLDTLEVDLTDLMGTCIANKKYYVGIVNHIQDPNIFERGPWCINNAQEITFP